jgi:hypothetical protein
LSDPEQEGLGVGPVRIPDYLRPVYANVVNVNHTPWDFKLTFGLVRTPMPGAEMEQAERDGVVVPEGVAEIVIPANLMAALITTMKTNFDGYMSRFGVPGFDPEGPQVEGGEG